MSGRHKPPEYCLSEFRAAADIEHSSRAGIERISVVVIKDVFT
jgi:hypothetical protein